MAKDKKTTGERKQGHSIGDQGWADGVSSGENVPSLQKQVTTLSKILKVKIR